MGYIQRLPFILSSIITIIIGLVCYFSGVGTRDTFIRMIISMTVFYIVGLYIRKLIFDINEQIDEKKQKELLESQKKAEEEAKNNNTAIGKEIDLTIDSENDNVDDDEFTPLKASSVIRNSYLKTE